MSDHKPVLYIVACGGYVAGQLEGLIQRLNRRGWRVCVIASPSAVAFMDRERLARLTGHVVRSDYKQPDSPDVLPVADAVAVIPATFNTINKCAGGVSDTLALGVLHEAIGAGLPIVAVPTPNSALGKHPVFLASVATLRSWGVNVLFDPTINPLPPPRTGIDATDFFPWAGLEAAIEEMRSRVSK